MYLKFLAAKISYKTVVLKWLPFSLKILNDILNTKNQW